MAGFGGQKRVKKTALQRNTQVGGEGLREIALVYYMRGDILSAEKAYREALRIGYLHPDIFLNLGVICKNSGRPDEAILMYKKAIAIKPSGPDAYANLGNLYRELGNPDQALSSTLKSLELKSDNPTAHMNLGWIYKDLGELDQALASTMKSLELKPDHPDAYMNLGGIYKDLGELDQALASTLKSVELKPDNPTAYMNLGGIYKDLGELDQSLVSTLKSVELKPDNPTAHMNLSGIYQAMGDMEKSAESLQKALAINPRLPGALLLSSMSLEDVHKSHSLLLKMEGLDEKVLPLSDQIKIEFAKANCFHHQKDYKNAVASLRKANELKLLYKPSNAATWIKRIQVITNTLTANEVLTSEDHCDRIFIVGLPRSGSTLLSVILNTNPLAKDLGESNALPNAIRVFSSQDSVSQWQNLGHFYADCIGEVIPPGSITIDKQLNNFLHCHHIAKHIPGAKIIHATRNPLDHVLSMLKANLVAGNNYTASVEDSAMMIIEQERLMREFKKLFPGSVYTYSYDMLVNQPKAEAQKLLIWLGWDWCESYLDFHKKKQTINTASVVQARQPISNKSVGGWKNYSSLLEPARQLLLDSNLFLAQSLSMHP